MHCIFSVPGRPVGKQRRVGSGGRAYIPDKTTDYQKRVGWFAKRARPNGWPMRAFYQLRFSARYPDHSVADGDNISKCVKDALEGTHLNNGSILWENDIWVRKESHEVLTDPSVTRGGLLKVKATVIPKAATEV